MSSIGLSCFSLFWRLVCWKKSSDVFDAQINAWFIEINIVSQLILNHIRIHLTQLKQKPVQSKYVFWSFHKQIRLHFFCFKGVLFYISYSLCQIVNLFLCKYIVKMHLWRTHFLNQPLSVCHSHIHCSLVMSLHLSLFLLCLSSDISSHSDLLGIGRSTAAEWHFSSKVSSVGNPWICQDTVVSDNTAGFHFCADDKNKNTNVMFTHLVLLRERWSEFSTDSGVIGNTNICISVKFYCGS